ncbi:hypothetical protein TNCV_3841231 [Trichonephila clavipes]|nr:hypothetical protein TNCV_3841231 [Trichonephila clavipes]
MPKRNRGITSDAARIRKAIRTRERRAAETVEERNKRLAAMAQRDQEKRADETGEQRRHRLSTMVQHARRRRRNVTEEQNCTNFLFSKNFSLSCC